MLNKKETNNGKEDVILKNADENHVQTTVVVCFLLRHTVIRLEAILPLAVPVMTVYALAFIW